VAYDGSNLSPTFQDDGGDPENTTWPIETDQDVIKTFEMANEFFAENRALKRPSLLIHVSKDPNAPPPPVPPNFLQNLPDPSQTETMTMLSFYAFSPSGIIDPDEFALALRKQWKPFKPLGRVYVAQEGVNAQMSIPTNVLENFMECCKSIPELGVHMENGINVDPMPLSVEEFAVAGVPVNGKPAPPFRNLHVRVRGQVVADGLEKPLDWQQAGYDMPPLEWHQKLKEARERQESGDPNVPLILDCRNDYESDVGRFQGAEPLNTENFRESWQVLKERLAHTPKDAPIMTYCTGGIRCVKVGAYLTQELGFRNVSRLAGGIIAYDRTIREKGEEPMFKGTNFVFDGRLGRAITEDSLGSCVTCAAVTSLVSNCRNDNCHKRMVQCQECRTSFHGTCSDACRNRIMNGAMMPRRTKINVQEAQFSNLEDYSAGHSSPPPSLYREMEFNTKHFLPSGSPMVSGASQGRWLTQLVSMTREGRVLELGTFTGYATACFLEGAANAGEAVGVSGGNRESGPFVMTMERDARAIDVAVAHLKVMCAHGVGEEAAEAACEIRASGNERE
jgi:predicted sulfurtransferase